MDRHDRTVEIYLDRTINITKRIKALSADLESAADFFKYELFSRTCRQTCQHPEDCDCLVKATVTGNQANLNFNPEPSPCKAIAELTS